MSNSSKITKTKIIVVLGPTASGKSALAVRIARSLKSAAKIPGGEIISADSRQVYKGLDIGSGKITEAEMEGVPHHLLDVASPKKVFTVAEFQKMGRKAIEEIVARGNVPIICGGSAFYIQGLVDGTVFPEVLPNHALRARLEKMPLQKLQALLKKMDPRRFAEIDQQNPVRLIRAIEIATALGKVPALPKPQTTKSTGLNSASYDTLFIGTTIPTEELHKKIKKRLDVRMKDGMVAEVAGLHKAGVSWKRLESFGLEYRAIAEFLQKKKKLRGKKAGLTELEKEMRGTLETNIRQFAKRQMTWFKKDPRIKWFNPKDWQQIKNAVDSFLA